LPFPIPIPDGPSAGEMTSNDFCAGPKWCWYSFHMSLFRWRNVRQSLVLMIALFLPAVVTPVSPGTDLVVPAVARVGSWVTDLILFNPGDETAEVEIHWLERGRPNPDPPGVALTLAPHETRILGDVVYGSFGLEVGEGALSITGDTPIVANCRVFSRDGDATNGQVTAGVPAAWATSGGTASHVVGLTTSTDFRSNVYALAGPEGAVVRLALLDLSGSEAASTVLQLGTREPFLRRVDRLFKIDPLGEATLLLEVQSGSAVIGASRIDNTSADPTTLTSWIDHDAVAAGLVFGAVHGATSTGGIALAITPALEVEGLEFTFPAERCESSKGRRAPPWPAPSPPPGRDGPESWRNVTANTVRWTSPWADSGRDPDRYKPRRLRRQFLILNS